MYNWTNYMTCGNWNNVTNYKDFFLGSAFGALLVLGLILIILFCIAIYIYNAIAWFKIGKNMKYKRPWLAWIPFAGSAMRLQMGGFSWGWIFLVLIPILGWIPFW